MVTVAALRNKTKMYFYAKKKKVWPRNREILWWIREIRLGYCCVLTEESLIVHISFTLGLKCLLKRWTFCDTDCWGSLCINRILIKQYFFLHKDDINSYLFKGRKKMDYVFFFNSLLSTTLPLSLHGLVCV